MHALETDDVLALARHVRQLAPDVPIVLGGHTAAAYPDPFLDRRRRRRRARRRRARAAGDRGRARAGARPLRSVPGLASQRRRRRASGPTRAPDVFDLDAVPLPARRLVDGWRRQYACLAHRPTWLIETARGCPFRCSFCSIWQLHARSVRERSIESVCQDFAASGDDLFIADDLFWYHPSRSRGAGAGAAAPRHPQEVDPRPEPGRPRRAACRPARGVAAARQRVRHLLRPRGGDRRRASPASPRTRRSTRRSQGIEVARSLEVRRHRQLRDRSGVERGGLRAAMGLRRAPPAVPGRLHDPDAAAGHGLLRGDAAAPPGARRWSQFDMHHLLWEPALGPSGSSSCTARRGAARS